MGLNISICLYYLILHVKHVLSDLNKLKPNKAVGGGMVGPAMTTF